MTDLAGYLQRVSYALRQGKPANDVALLLPDDDAWATFNAAGQSSSHIDKTKFSLAGADLSIDESMGRLLGPNVISQILDAGFNLDFIDASAVDSVGIPYPVLVLPGIERLPLATYRKIEQYAKHGGIVIAIRRLPSVAPGLVNATEETKEINEISRRLFRAENAPAYFLEDDAQLGVLAARHYRRDVIFTPRSSELGFIHRKLSAGDLYFIANTSNRVVETRAQFRDFGKSAEVWDPFTGRATLLERSDNIHLTLQPYESRLVFFSNSASQSEPVHSDLGHSETEIDLSSDWDLTFNGWHRTLHMTRLHSWSDEEEFKYYSGQVLHERTFDLPANTISGHALILDFGAGTPAEKPDPLPAFNMRAYLEGPVREAADVYVNGEHAGVVWHPPYNIDITSFLKPGKNQLRILVGNTAINSLAGTTLPDYRLLNDRYGQRFVPQDMQNLQTLPSGLTGGVRLQVISNSARQHPHKIRASN